MDSTAVSRAPSTAPPVGVESFSFSVSVPSARVSLLMVIGTVTEATPIGNVTMTSTGT